MSYEIEPGSPTRPRVENQRSVCALNPVDLSNHLKSKAFSSLMKDFEIFLFDLCFFDSPLVEAFRKTSDFTSKRSAKSASNSNESVNFTSSSKTFVTKNSSRTSSWMNLLRWIARCSFEMNLSFTLAEDEE